MLEAAKQIVEVDGCSGLRVREVAKRAGVNLGMFHYHFKSKDRLIQILLSEYYEEFFSRLQQAVKIGGDSLASLRAALVASGCYAAEERTFFFSFFRDLLNENAQVIQFAATNVPRHMAIFHDLIRKCQDEGELVKMPLESTMSFLMSSIHMPTLMGYAMVRRATGVSKKKAQRGQQTRFKNLYAEEAIRMRVDSALKGLRP